MVKRRNEEEPEGDEADERRLVDLAGRLEVVHVCALLHEEARCEEHSEEHTEIVELEVRQLRVRLNPKNMDVVDLVLAQNLHHPS